MKFILLFLFFFSIFSSHIKLKTRLNRGRIIIPIFNETQSSSNNTNIIKDRNPEIKIPLINEQRFLELQIIICILMAISMMGIFCWVQSYLKEKERKLDFDKKFAEILSSDI